VIVSVADQAPELRDAMSRPTVSRTLNVPTVRRLRTYGRGRRGPVGEVGAPEQIVGQTLLAAARTKPVIRRRQESSPATVGTMRTHYRSLRHVRSTLSQPLLPLAILSSAPTARYRYHDWILETGLAGDVGDDPIFLPSRAREGTAAIWRGVMRRRREKARRLPSGSALRPWQTINPKAA